MVNNHHASIKLAVTAVVVVALLAFLVKGFQERRKAIELKRQGAAMPPHHPVFGHILVLARIMSKLPKDTYPHYLVDQLRQNYPDMGPIFYLDAWPFITLTFLVASPATKAQVTTERVLPKFPAIKDFLYPIANGKDIVSMNGQEWKYWRSIFNPGFGASHLISLVPGIVSETEIFCDLLQSHAQKQDVFRMKQLTDDLAMDVIGKIVLDFSLGCQLKGNPMVNALRRQMRWMVFGSEGNPFQQLHPLRPFIHWYNTYQMDQFLSPLVDERFNKLKGACKSGEASSNKFGNTKSVINLALLAYLKDNPHIENPAGMDPHFKNTVINQIKLFLFSGHDTTSSALCYILYLLSTHPHALSALRTEHNTVLGLDLHKATARLSQDPYLLNKLPYTTGVIKESMRLYPAASTTRRGEPSFAITDPRNGMKYPADSKTFIWLVSHACHRDPALWPRATEFLPERWLAKEGEELWPKPGAWRPFELGPRTCIGKELSMLELKIVLCLTARRFEVKAVYEELDAEEDGGFRSFKGKSIRVVNGDRAYQVGKGEPSGFLPCRVRELPVET